MPIEKKAETVQCWLIYLRKFNDQLCSKDGETDAIVLCVFLFIYTIITTGHFFYHELTFARV